MSSLLVNEIFHSIQGESTWSGIPCVFVRLTSCNLRCVWCDTAYAFYDGRSMTIDQIVGTVQGYGCHLVEVTGGEPLLQEGVFELMTRLCDLGHEVLVETGGSLDISLVDPRVRRIVDLKCPGSGMESRNLWANVAHLRSSDEVKFVIRDRGDFSWAVEVIREHNLTSRCPVLMSPVFGELENLRLAEWILESRIPVRMQVQLHKYVWHPDAKGV